MNKSEFISILAVHREILKSVHEKPGWNKWALTGALASMGWILIDFLGLEQSVLRDAMLLFLAIALFEPMPAYWKRLFPSPSIQRPKYKSSWEQVLKSKTEIRFDYLLYITIFLLSNWVFDLSFFAKLYVNVFMVYEILGIVVGLLAFKKYKGPIPSSLNPSNLIKQNKSLGKYLTIITIITLVIQILPVLALLSGIGSFNSLDLLKITLLICGIYFVAKKLILDKEDTMLINSVERLIDDLTFDRVKVDTAQSELKIILIGMEFKDAMAPITKKFIDACSNYREALRKSELRFNEYQESGEENRDELKKEFNKQIALVRPASEELTRIKKKTIVQLGLLKFIEGESEEYEAVINNLEHELDDAAEQHKEFEINVVEVAEASAESSSSSSK